MTFDYKKYSLERLEEWLYDALSASEASPQEIYDVIKKVVEEQYHCYKNQTQRCYELLALLNGNGVGHIQAYDDYIGSTVSSTQYTDEELDAMCDKAEAEEKKKYEDKNGVTYINYVKAQIEANSAWNDGWTREHYQKIVDKYEGKKDKVKKWILPIELHPSGEYFFTFPDDLLEAANIKEGDELDWIDQGDGSYLLKKVENRSTSTYNDMVAAGYTMTDDGFWIKE